MAMRGYWCMSICLRALLRSIYSSVSELGYTPLTWKQRITIALDVARGVEYLHSLAQQSFIHRDLKPSNILIGDDMRAKVADFGLVKNAPDGKYSLEARLAGTFGYLAPEYAATGRVTTKIDVYAYGVVLMEIITGRKSLDDSMPDEKAHLVTWFRRQAGGGPGRAGRSPWAQVMLGAPSLLLIGTVLDPNSFYCVRPKTIYIFFSFFFCWNNYCVAF
ncbi:hypothetical protein ACOSQ2_006671 [Xanthoceras sorbifolium]